jgi:hypothetical protein
LTIVFAEWLSVSSGADEWKEIGLDSE